LVYINQTI